MRVCLPWFTLVSCPLAVIDENIHVDFKSSYENILTNWVMLAEIPSSFYDKYGKKILTKFKTIILSCVNKS